MNEDLVLIFGNFNILHPGHLTSLRFESKLLGSKGNQEYFLCLKKNKE